MIWRISSLGLALAGLAACGPSYSPDTYASNAVQQANKVEQGTVIGVRNVGVSAAGTVGTVAGAAAGGIAGSQVVPGPANALTALGGSLVGGIAGSTVEHVTSDTAAFEYIVRKANAELVSVTQHDKTPLALGQKVLVISGNQARVVPDYTVPPDISAPKSVEAPKPAHAAKPPDAAPPPDADAASPPEAAKAPNAARAQDAARAPEAAKAPDAARAPDAANSGSPDAGSPHAGKPAEPVQPSGSTTPVAAPAQAPAAAVADPAQPPAAAGSAPAKQPDPGKP